MIAGHDHAPPHFNTAIAIGLIMAFVAFESLHGGKVNPLAPLAPPADPGDNLIDRLGLVRSDGQRCLRRG